MLCVGGAGAKADSTRLRFVDLADASMDPLMRSVRHQLRKKFNVTSGVDCLLSMERPRCGLVTTEEQAAAPSMRDYQACSPATQPQTFMFARTRARRCT